MLQTPPAALQGPSGVVGLNAFLLSFLAPSSARIVSATLGRQFPDWRSDEEVGVWPEALPGDAERSLMTEALFSNDNGPPVSKGK